MREILVASSNPHKVEEIRAILADCGITVVGLDAVQRTIAEPEEDGATFAENARLKAVHYARATGRVCLADDSGLEVDALDGAPGVRSARYAGIGVGRAERDAANNAKLLRELDGVPADQLHARFVCAMSLVDSDGRVLHESRGTMEGRITREPAGSNGFGYDPLLWLDDAQCTSAELEPAAKNARSHRGAATRAMAAWISTHASDSSPA